MEGAAPEPRARLFAQNDRNLSATLDERLKLVATPGGRTRVGCALFDRTSDPGETRDVSRLRPDDLRVQRRELELFQERVDSEWTRLRGALVGVAGAAEVA